MKVSIQPIPMSKKDDSTRGLNGRMKTIRSKKNAQSYRRRRHLGLNMLAYIRAFATTTFVQLITPTDRQEDDDIDAKESTGRITTWTNVQNTNEARQAIDGGHRNQPTNA